MKVLIVNGSSHVNGTTMQAVQEVEKVFHDANVDTEVIQLGNKPIRDCIQCGYCFKHGECVFKDDDVNAFVEKAKDADGFIFATPVYYAHPSGRILSFLDRVFFSAENVTPNPFAFKPGASIAVARRVVQPRPLMCLINTLVFLKCQLQALRIGISAMA